MEFESFLSPMPRVVAHRGDSAFFPENTAEAFSSAASLGIDVIETDVHLTKDGEIVIWHDPTLERNTDGKGTLESHTLAELKRYDAGYTFTRDGGKTYPFRGKGVKLMQLEAGERLLAAVPVDERGCIVSGVGRGGKPREALLSRRSFAEHQLPRGRKGRALSVSWKAQRIRALDPQPESEAGSGATGSSSGGLVLEVVDDAAPKLL